jgi:hypothetical protein
MNALTHAFLAALHLCAGRVGQAECHLVNLTSWIVINGGMGGGGS